jgi:hypothetical protein
MIYEEIARSIGKLVDEKNAAYGSSFDKSDQIIKILYPEGVQPHQYKDLLAMTRVIDKLFRIATSKDAMGEDPWQDIAGYAILSVVSNKKENKTKPYYNGFVPEFNPSVKTRDKERAETTATGQEEQTEKKLLY